MAEQATIGGIYVFQVLFLDENQQPLVVVDPTVTIATFSTAGTRNVLVDAAPMTEVLGEVGRYAYPYSISSVFTAGTILTGTMIATDPDFPEARLLDDVTVYLNASPSFGRSGLTAQFVRGG